MGRVDGEGTGGKKEEKQMMNSAGEKGSRKRAGENLAVLGWADMAGQPVFVV